MPISPADLAKAGTEHSHQRAFFSALVQDERCPRSHPLWHAVAAWAHAIPNGGDRDVITAGKLKAEGVKPGVWDVFVPVPVRTQSRFDTYQDVWRHGLYLEFKKPARRNHKFTATGWSLGGKSVAAGTPNAIPTHCPPGTIVKGGLSEFQWVFGVAAFKLGYHASVVYTWEEALVETINYIEGRA